MGHALPIFSTYLRGLCARNVRVSFMAIYTNEQLERLDVML
jgi:hypothetical protein